MKYDQWKIEVLDHTDESFAVGRNVFSDGKFSYERLPKRFDIREKAEDFADALNLMDREKSI